MADRYLLESSVTDGYLLEDGTGIILLDGPTVKVITDVLQVVESVLRLKHLFKIFTDVVQTVESVLKVRSLTRVFTDVVQTIETLIRRLTFVRVTNEVFQLVESTLHLKSIRQTINETLQLVESILYPKRIRQVINETLELLSVTVGDIETALIKIINEAISTVESMLKFVVTTVIKKGYAVAIRTKHKYILRRRR